MFAWIGPALRALAKYTRPVLFNVLFLGALYLIAKGMLDKPQWDWPHLVIASIGAMFLALLGNMDQIESIKAGAAGIEAKTRQVVAEAEVAVTEIRHLAIVLSGALVEAIDGGGRWGGSTAVNKDIQKARIREALNRMGIDKAGIETAFARERVWAIVDYDGAITQSFPVPQEKLAFWNSTFKDYNAQIAPMGAEKLRKVLLEVGPLEPWREGLLQDLEHYMRTGKHRRPDLWEQRHTWYEWTTQKTWPSWAVS